jgi:hypothetical protein
MSNDHSVDELLGFLEHASDRGLMPAATATALAVASRNVFGILSEAEKKDVRELDLESVAKRFQNKRAKDFSSDTLKEYERRVNRAVGLFQAWREDPANFRAPTRATSAGRKRRGNSDAVNDREVSSHAVAAPAPAAVSGTYQTSLPLGPDRIVTLVNVPADLTAAEAERLAVFVRMLAVGSTAQAP